MSTLSNRYTSEDKKDEVSNRLLPLTTHDFVETEWDGYCTFSLEKLIARIKTIPPMDRRKDRDEEEKPSSSAKP